MRSILLAGIAGLVFLMSVGLETGPAAESESVKNNEGVRARIAADYIYAVIEAGRMAYSRYIVDRFNQDGTFKVTENWKAEKGLLLPAQFLKLSSSETNSKGIGMRYRLSSVWPLNTDNLPRSETEKSGLLEVLRNPDEPFTWIVQKNGLWYYQAIYPDKAVSQTCVECHNQHPASPKRDFKIGDVMGGIVIDLPLGSRFRKKPDESIALPPEVVADYVHAVLESDRTVYANHVVQHLENGELLKTSGPVKTGPQLMLPAQFLKKVSQIAARKSIGLEMNLLSLWPINPQNAPSNEFERDALEWVSIHPVRPFVRWTRAGNVRYFNAVYPDYAISTACVECHNQHPTSPRNDFKLNDVMGGLRVSFPVK
ncbi:conserved exported hypothetical protein, putative diheme cytochrome c (modular protein) [Nitrospina gracilis 3/211]|uniref:Tll0287-like domain-containing protein n=1 Tax=Nitrospina gracilis (strain 3/211) TaxID=1266370 RepID=M1YY29_NITG3|nr:MULTISPECIES: DUF3365 domain-containing protein [Nitrospina]MCF8723357.1 hypothetical protein [Nitrospina sp. Nb-3]CCQ90412.1 conserved exported hypothetical protein, putative diheme cytochrome c (modular protein) [Nitrospina gracilis 3/211]